MARSVGSGTGRNNSLFLFTFALASVLLILVYIYWSKTSAIRQLVEENDIANTALQKAQADIKTLQDRASELSEELASSEQKKADLEKERKDLKLQVEEGVNKLRTVNDNLKAMTTDWESRVKEVDAKENQLRTATVTMNDYKTRLDACEPRADSLLKDLTAVKEQQAAQQKAMSELEEKKNSIVKGMQDEILALKEQCSKQSTNAQETSP